MPPYAHSFLSAQQLLIPTELEPTPSQIILEKMVLPDPVIEPKDWILKTHEFFPGMVLKKRMDEILTLQGQILPA